MKILIIGPGAFSEASKGSPEVGRYYHLDDATTGTAAQNRFFHLLLNEFDKTDAEMTKPEQKRWVKKNLGEGAGEYLYWDNDRWNRVEKKEDIPSEIIKDRSRCFALLKSWSEYTLPQRKKCIDNLIRHMIKIGVNSKRFNEICKEFYDEN